MNPQTRLFGMPAEKGRWVFVGVGFLINLCMGANFSYSVFRKPLESLYQIGATQSGLPFTFYLASFVLFTLIASRYIERLGPEKAIRIGAVIIALGWISAGFAPNITALSILYGIVGGAGVGFTYGSPIAVSSRWFPDKKGLAVGLTLAGYGISPIMTAPIAGALTGAYGPLVAFRFIGCGMALLVFISSFFQRFPKDGWAPCAVAGSGNNPACPDVELKPLEIFQRSSFFGLYTCYFLAAFSGPMAIGISSPVGQEVIGLTVVQATGFVAVFAIFNGTGRTLFGYLADQLTPRWASALSFVIILLASLGMLASKTGDVALYAICFEAFWLTMGGWIAIAPASTSTFFGSRFQVKNYGLVFTAYGLGGICGIVVSGMIKDYFGSYQYAFYPTAAVAILGIIISLVLLKMPLSSGQPRV